MKRRTDSKSGRGKGERRMRGMIMDEKLVISSGSDYDPREEGYVESEGNVSLE